MRMICSEMITSEEYQDFIFENNPRIFDIEDFTAEEICINRIDENWSVGYGRLQNGKQLTVSDIGYQTIPKLYGLMDVSAMEEAGIINTLNQPFLNLDGSGVLIGIIDTGVDYRLDILKRSPVNTKIEIMWDQSVNKDNSEVREILGWQNYYGSFYTENNINEALRAYEEGNNPYDYVNVRDENGHGTIVAGLACGNSDDDFTGAAPGASLAIVKLKKAKKYLREFYKIKDSAEAYEETDIMMGVKFLADYAAYRRLPLVILCTLCTGSGPRNGETPLGSVLAGMARQSRVAVITAMGNEGNSRGHVSGIIRGRQTPSVIELNTGNNEKGYVLELWSAGNDIFSVAVISPSGETTGRIPARAGISTRYRFLLENSEVAIDYRVIEPVSGYELIFMRFDNPVEGLWRIEVYSTDEVNGEFNAWLPLKQFISENTFFLNADASRTLCEPAAAGRVISVGGYNHNNNSFYIDSGRGYNVYNAVKPDIVAPAVNVYAIRPGNIGERVSGTSVAAAITAGAAAILLQYGIEYGNSITIGTSEIKNILIRGARRQNETIQVMEYPNNSWGYGILDLYNSLINIRVT